MTPGSVSAETGATSTAARAAVWHGGPRVTVERFRLAAPAPDEIVVRVDLATVCGSDRHTVSGRRPGPTPSVLGHEAVGTVMAVGSARPLLLSGEPVRPGDRVVWSVTVACGACDRCRAGRTAKCRSVRKVGHERLDEAWPLSGSYATHVVLPAGTALARVPGALPDAAAAPAACATATVVAAAEAARRAVGTLAGKRVLVVGAGMLGLCAAALAAAEGAADVVVTDVDPGRLAAARDFGATATRPAGEVLPAVDVAFELSGATSAVSAALDALDVGGVLVLVGSVAPAPPLALDPERVVRSWLTVTGVHNYEPRHLQQAVEFLAATQPTRRWERLVEPPVTLDELPELLLGPPTGRPRGSVRPYPAP
ncbi:alcohol dehydrogenase catalytic domain-containing protein [Luteimicrobium sp. DT211]|uniref:alcohol dehydrogenase catalytic domain-containing protein n=1 Tax=Luteimicrobium sp. DT211 TaxID=3393412 RepID=UPI003CE9FB9E